MTENVREEESQEDIEIIQSTGNRQALKKRKKKRKRNGRNAGRIVSK